jgi:hypothetical protein
VNLIILATANLLLLLGVDADHQAVPLITPIMKLQILRIFRIKNKLVAIPRKIFTRVIEIDLSYRLCRMKTN